MKALPKTPTFVSAAPTQRPILAISLLSIWLCRAYLSQTLPPASSTFTTTCAPKASKSAAKHSNTSGTSATAFSAAISIVLISATRNAMLSPKTTHISVALTRLNAWIQSCAILLAFVAKTSLTYKKPASSSSPPIRIGASLAKSGIAAIPQIASLAHFMVYKHS